MKYNQIMFDCLKWYVSCFKTNHMTINNLFLNIGCKQMIHNWTLKCFQIIEYIAKKCVPCILGIFVHKRYFCNDKFDKIVIIHVSWFLYWFIFWWLNNFYYLFVCDKYFPDNVVSVLLFLWCAHDKNNTILFCF